MSPGDSAAAIAALEKRIPELMEQARIPGMSIALIRGGRVVWHRGFGVASAATKEPVGNDTIFEAASLSKPSRVSKTLSWGLGWGLEKVGKTEYFWHWGDNGPFRCFVMASRQNRAGMVMFTNSINGLSIVGDLVRISMRCFA